MSERVGACERHVREGHNTGRRVSILTDGAQWELFHLVQAGNELESVSTYLLRPDARDTDGLLTWLEGVFVDGGTAEPMPRLSPPLSGPTSSTTTGSALSM